MRTVFFAVLVTAIAGCQQSSTSNEVAAQQTATPVTNFPGETSTPVKFEIRDFKLDEQKESYGTIFKGRGTLVTKDDAIKKGNYMVWLSVKEAQNNDERGKQLIILRDGIGTIETRDFVARDEREKKKVKYFDWEIIGFVKLQEGVIISDEPTSAK